MLVCDQVGCNALRFGIVAEGFDPVHVGLAAKPGELALGVVAMALLGFGNGHLLADALEENGLRLTVSERVERLDRSVAAREEPRVSWTSPAANISAQR